MARLKKTGPLLDRTPAFKNLLKKNKFAEFYEKYKDFLEKATYKDILYKTQWSEKGWYTPEGSLGKMEKIAANA
jgi:hypothetical protein